MDRFIIGVEINPDDSEDFLEAFGVFMKTKVPNVIYGVNRILIKEEIDENDNSGLPHNKRF